MDKSLIDKAVVFMANDESAETADPGDGAFDLPAAAIATQFPTVLGVRSTASTSMRTDQIPTFGQQARAQFIAVIGSIRNQGKGRFSGGHFVDQFLDERDLSR